MTVRYRAWDNMQAVIPLAPERVLNALADALLSGRIEQALDGALHRGIDGDDGDTLTGLDHLREQLRAERRQTAHDLQETESLGDLVQQLLAGESGGGALDAESSRVLEALAARPDAARRLVQQLGPEARAALDGALEQLRADVPLGSDAEGEPLSLPADLDGLLNRLQHIDELEQRLRRVRSVADVADVDPAQIRALLGDAAGDRYQQLSESLRAFVDSGYVRGSGAKLELSARALQHLGDALLNAALARLATRQPGERRSLLAGSHDLTGTSRDYQFGDPLSLDLSRTVLQAVQRGRGLPVRLEARDFAIFEREESSRAATVLAIDLSRSMGERGYLLAAKKLALALRTLIRTRYPRDQLLLAGFSATARPLTPSELPRLGWDRFGFGTNIQDALQLARGLLAAHRGMQRLVILLTDGEPTAHRDADGVVQFHHPPSPDTLSRTYAEADRLRRDGINLCVCVLSSQLQVVRVAEQLARHAAGELILTDPDDLSAATLLQFGQRRRS